MKNYLVNEEESRKDLFDDWYYVMAKNGIFAGLVYLYYPELVKRLKLTKEQAYWMAFLNSASQNICTVWVIFNEFPELPRTEEELERFKAWHADNQQDLAYDTDRRYFRTKLPAELEQYLIMLGGLTQQEFFEEELFDENNNKYFRNVYNSLNSIKGWGRLTTWSATEFYKILGELPIEWDTFFMNDVKGSKSQRNGYLKSIGQDELVWDKRQNNGVETHEAELMFCIEHGAMTVVDRLKKKFSDEPFYNIIGPETVETAFCSFKNSFFGRRYVTSYVDMSYFRIKKAEEKWVDVDFSIFWDIRKEMLPKEFCIEFNPKDLEIVSKSLDKGEKGAFFKETGIPPMMSVEFPEKYKCDYDKNIQGETNV